MSRLLRARLGYSVGLLAAAGGVGIEFGPGWALITGGLAVAASFLILSETDEEEAAGDKPAPTRTLGQR